MRKLHTVRHVLLTLRFYYCLSAHPRMFEEEEGVVWVYGFISKVTRHLNVILGSDSPESARNHDESSSGSVALLFCWNNW